MRILFEWPMGRIAPEGDDITFRLDLEFNSLPETAVYSLRYRDYESGESGNNEVIDVFPSMTELLKLLTDDERILNWALRTGSLAQRDLLLEVTDTERTYLLSVER